MVRNHRGRWIISGRQVFGRKVVGEGFHSCRNCAPCARGEAILCEQEYDEIGFTRSGGWATSLIIPAEQLHVLSDDADLRSAAGLEPVVCAAEAVYRATVEKGDRVAIVGAGTIGTLTVQLLRGGSLNLLSSSQMSAPRRWHSDAERQPRFALPVLRTTTVSTSLSKQPEQHHCPYIFRPRSPRWPLGSRRHPRRLGQVGSCGDCNEANRNSNRVRRIERCVECSRGSVFRRHPQSRPTRHARIRSRQCARGS